MSQDIEPTPHAVELPVWGVKAIAGLINRNPRQTYYLLERGLIPGARKVGEQWTGLPSRIRGTFTGEVG